MVTAVAMVEKKMDGWVTWEDVFGSGRSAILECTIVLLMLHWMMFEDQTKRLIDGH